MIDKLDLFCSDEQRFEKINELIDVVNGLTPEAAQPDCNIEPNGEFCLTHNCGWKVCRKDQPREAAQMIKDPYDLRIYGLDVHQFKQMRNFWNKHHAELPEAANSEEGMR